MTKNKNPEEKDLSNYIKRCMSVPAKERLEFLEEMNDFFYRFVPRENKAIWQKLKKRGW